MYQKMCSFYKTENDVNFIKEKMSIGSGVFIFPCFRVREMGNNTSAVFYELLKARLVPSAVVCFKLDFISPVLFAEHWDLSR